MDLESQSVQDAEKAIERLAEQAAQEKAMADVLPARFAANMEAFQQWMPGIAKEFRDYIPTRSFRFFCSENGIPNLLWLDENKAQYSDDPYADCQNQISSVLNESSLLRFNFATEKNLFDQLHVEYMNRLVTLYRDAEKQYPVQDKLGHSMPLCIMFGIGLGYQLGYLYEQCTPRNMFIFEPDNDLFYASLFCFDWAPLLQHIHENHLGLHLFIGQDDNNLMDDMLTAINKRGAFLSANLFAFWHYPSPQIFSLMERVTREFYILSTGWGFFDDNLLAMAHSAANIQRGTPFLKKGAKIPAKWQKLPVFVVGNGPSLDAALPLIKKYQDRVILVACGSSISALHKQGIKPDIYVAIERTKAVQDFLGLLNDPDYLRDILFLSSDVIHPACHDYFARTGLGFKPNEPIYPLCAIHLKAGQLFEPLSFINPLVGNIGISMPTTLGFEQIYMFGLDNGYREKGHHHSKHSAYYDQQGNPIEALTKIVTDAGGFRVPGNFGGQVIANRLFGASGKVMANMLTNRPHVSCYNCSDGALISGATPLPLDNLNLDGCSPLSKTEILDYIYTNLFEPVPVTQAQLQEKLAVDVFNDVIDSLIRHWQKPVLSRDDALERMQQEYEYIAALTRSGHHHIYRVMSGSLNYLFALLSTIAYRFSEEEQSLSVLNQAILVMIEYFEAAKRKYPRALELLDEVDCEIIQLYRKNDQTV